MSLLIVPDVGPKTVELLLKKEVKSIEDLISFYPNTYSTYNYNTIKGIVKYFLKKKKIKKFQLPHIDVINIPQIKMYVNI